jgi:hypothetical protein
MHTGATSAQGVLALVAEDQLPCIRVAGMYSAPPCVAGGAVNLAEADIQAGELEI